MVDKFEVARRRMVDEQLVARGITDGDVLAAMRTVPRHEYVPGDVATDAYADGALPIGHGATISQPYIVALMAQALSLVASDRVLEVGTGSGYAAAILAELADHVTTVECVDALAVRAAERFADDSVRVEVVHADGSMGYAPNAPYDAISVAATGATVPAPLLEQLAPGGRLVMPVGVGDEQLTLVSRTSDGDVSEVIAAVRFVPLRGRFGV